MILPPGLKCPHCTNSDPTLVEMVAVVRDRDQNFVSGQYLCAVCTRQFVVARA